MRYPMLRHPGFAPLALGLLLASSPLARADDAGDAGPSDGGGSEAADIDVGVDAAESSMPADAIVECPVENIGNPCDGGGTCIPATCADWGSATAQYSCAACSNAAVQYCAPRGPFCGNGEVCDVMGGGTGSGVSPDGGSEFVSYTNMGCGPLSVPSPPGYSAKPDGHTSSAAPPACCVVAPLGAAPGRFAALAAALAIAIAARRRRHARPRRAA